MKAARCRISGEGELVYEWKRLSGFSRGFALYAAAEGPAVATWLADDDTALAMVVSVPILPGSEPEPA